RRHLHSRLRGRQALADLHPHHRLGRRPCRRARHRRRRGTSPGGPRRTTLTNGGIANGMKTLLLTSFFAVSVLVAGCGGGRTSGVANLPSSTTTNATATQNGLVAFARCMRSNGVPSFPDPQHFA